MEIVSAADAVLAVTKVTTAIIVLNFQQKRCQIIFRRKLFLKNGIKTNYKNSFKY